MLDILQIILSLVILIAVLALHTVHPLPRNQLNRKRRVAKHLRPYDELRLTNL